MAIDPGPRHIEQSHRINAPLQAVWKAISEADELVRWFPLEARVKPGRGGSVFMSWGGEQAWETPVEVWEANKHLRLVYCEATPAPKPGEPPPAFVIPYRVVVDYHLEAAGGQTVLRLVHSGFSRDAAWDGQYDGTVSGWDFQLSCLKHYLERHAGQPRETIYRRVPLGGQALPEAWAAMFGERGLGGGADLLHRAEGDRLVLDGGDGLRFEGAVRRVKPPTNLAMTLANFNDGILRIHLDECFGRRDLYFFVCLWGVPAGEAVGLRGRCEELLDRLFQPATAPAGA